MNREIKFRAKELGTGKWVYGHYTQGSETTHYITTPNGGVWEVDPKTVSEHLSIKDDNEKEIYEGDILKFNDSLFSVEFFEGSYFGRGSVNNPTRGYLDCSQFCVSEIIGNIYETPELLQP